MYFRALDPGYPYKTNAETFSGIARPQIAELVRRLAKATGEAVEAQVDATELSPTPYECEGPHPQSLGQEVLRHLAESSPEVFSGLKRGFDFPALQSLASFSLWNSPCG